MNIATVGVKGYEYQYKVTCFIALSKAIPNNLELFVEKKGSEDATLTFKSGSNTSIIEIQVKREKQILNINKLTNWLCHFQERSHSNNLLSRLSDDSNNSTIFVTHSRCSDETVRFKRGLSEIEPHENLNITKSWNDKFRSSLDSTEFSKSRTSLGKKRDQFCKSQGKYFQNIDNTKNIFNRVIIWEEVSDEKIDNEILVILNKKYNIPQSQTEDTYLNLLEAVKIARDNLQNIIPPFEKVLILRSAARPIVVEDYYSREEESDLFEHLRKSSLLLLTGNSLCGKSEFAKRIASKFFDEGFNYRIFTDLAEVYHFFSLNSQEDKIAILEDPWGHLQKDDDSQEKWVKIEQIVSNLPLNHKLILTSKIEIIQDIHPLKNLSDCKIRGHGWHDLTIIDRNILISYWTKKAASKSLPGSVTSSIERVLSSEIADNLLQFGQLEYLAGNEIEDLKNKTADELEHFARQNSIDIAEFLNSKYSVIAELFSILAFSSNTINSVSFIDLGYILSDDDRKYSIIEKDFWTSTWSKEEPSFPQYEASMSISNETKKGLEYLENRRFIIIENSKIRFTHPNYYEAARHLFFSPSSIRQNQLFTYLKRTISCLNDRSAFLAVKQLSFLFKRLDPQYSKDIIEVAFLATDSIFPSVEDSAEVFLINNLESLSHEQKEKVIQSLDSFDTPSSHIFWYKDEIPFISPESSTFRFPYEVLEQSKLNDIEGRIIKGQLVTPFEAWNYITTVQNTRSMVLKKDIAQNLLQYNEVFIRKRTSFLFLAQTRNRPDSNLTKQIFLDEHPSVVFNAIRGSFLGWRNYDSQSKEFLFGEILLALEHPPIAIRANQLFTTFAKEHQSESINWSSLTEEETIDLWNVWGKLYPTFTKQLPPSVFLHTARFGMTMDEALKHLTLEIGLGVLSAWYDRIDYKISSGRQLDEFEMAIADNLFSFTKNNHEIRKDILYKLLEYPDTSFILSSLKWTIEYWEVLHATERIKIIELLKSDRLDIRWIRAISLNTHSNPPAEIQTTIFGDEAFFSKDVGFLIANFPISLLQDCLNVYCGYPQPLWWLAVHHKNQPFWGKLIRHILLNVVDSFFDVCIRELLTWGVNGFSSDWSDGMDIWKEVCNKSSDMRKLFQNLIFETASSSCNIDDTHQLWSILIDSYSKKGNLNEISNLLAEKIELLQETGHKEDVLEIIDSHFFFKNIYPKIEPDWLILSILNILKNTTKNLKNILPIFEEQLKDTSILRFYGTQNIIDKTLPEVVVSPGLKEKLQSLYFDENIGKNELAQLRGGEHYELGNWLHKKPGG